MVDINKLCGLIGIATKAGKIIAGTDACIEQIKNKNIKLIMVGKDASERTRNKFKQITDEFNIPVFEILSIEEISHSIGKNNKAVIGIKDIGFTNKIISIIHGG